MNKSKISRISVHNRENEKVREYLRGRIGDHEIGEDLIAVVGS
jgi:hypothetical protein